MQASEGIKKRVDKANITVTFFCISVRESVSPREWKRVPNPVDSLETWALVELPGLSSAISQLKCQAELEEMCHVFINAGLLDLQLHIIANRLYSPEGEIAFQVC